MMQNKSGWLATVLLGAMLVGSAGVLAAGDKTGEKGETRKGAVVGVVTAKADNYVEVKADGEEKARKYVPRYLANGLDKDMLKQIATLKIGSRVRLEWEFDERARVVRIEVLKAATPKEGK
jgi:hypothetical protein